MPNPALQLLRSRIGKVCVALTGASPEEMLERASASVKEAPFLEFRLDFLPDPAAALPLCREFLTAHTEATAIATCRRKANGGRFNGSAAGEMAILLEAANSGFHLADLELESAEALSREEVEKLRGAGLALMISFHDFHQTGELDAICRRMQPFAPDFFKIVPTAQTLADNVTLMRFIERVSDESAIVGVCMGDAGIISRVLGLRAGSAFTFGAASGGEATAPGQITARALIETYRVEDIDVSTKVYGVAGDPIGSSLSPVMMNTAFRRETVNAVYLGLQTSSIEDLASVLRDIPLQGVSITMPHKQTILPYLEHMDPLTAKIGACNTVLRQGGKLYGFNTDVQGILIPLSKRFPVAGAKILVLGAGGAARAAVFALRDKGAEVFLLNRTPEKAQKLAKQSGAKVIKREALSKASFDVILNATPVGMTGNSSEPLLKAEELKTKLVFDLVYNPVDTPLLRLARANGIPVITGVEMFVQQGARQFEIWTGKPAPEEEMLKVVLHALRQQAGASAEPHPPEPSPPPIVAVPPPEQPRAESRQAQPSPPLTQSSAPGRPAATSAKAATDKIAAVKPAPVKTVPVKAAPVPPTRTTMGKETQKAPPENGSARGALRPAVKMAAAGKSHPTEASPIKSSPARAAKKK